AAPFFCASASYPLLHGRPWAPSRPHLRGIFEIIRELAGMALRIGQDLEEEPPRCRIAITELAHEGGIGRHLLPFQHEILNNHLPERRALLGAHPDARRLRRDLHRAIEPMVLVSDKPINTIVLTSLIVLIMHFLHAGRQRDTLPGTEEPMITTEFITALFYEVDEQLGAIPKHPEAHLWPSEVVTLGLLHALKGVGNRPFYRWLTRDYRPLFPCLPERTRLFRLLKTHQDWTRAFLAAPTVLGVIDTYG